VSWTTCPCGKRAYSSETAARRAMRSAHYRVVVYQCQTSGKLHVRKEQRQREGEKWR
jgi:hypothetical protein